MQNLKNNEPRPKFTGSYKKKACSVFRLLAGFVRMENNYYVHQILTIMLRNIFKNTWGWNPENIEEHSASVQN